MRRVFRMADNTAEFTVAGVQREGTWEVVGRTRLW